VLLTRLFDKKRYATYTLALTISICAIAFIKMGYDQWLIQVSHQEGALSQLRYSDLPFITAVIANVAFLFITTPVRWMDDFYRRKELQQQSQQAQLEAELRFLKTQLNPHFLFNTLNNLYTLAFIGSEQTAPMILKLSEMMRYLLYESEARRVSLHQEIQYLNNFIELQQLKTPDPQQIEFEVQGAVAGKQIPPLLFVPLFENAFKHGNLDAGGWVKSKLELKEERLYFLMENSFIEHRQKDEVGGIGLENVQKRLELLFPSKHNIEQKKTKNTFQISLWIQLT